MKTKLLCTLILCSLIGSTNAFANNGIKKGSLSVQRNFSDSIQIHSYTVKKNNVRLYPNPTTNGIVTVNSNANEILHFYVFDLEGTLLHQIELKGKEQKTITNLKKGTYTYDVFKDDESIEQGKIIVK